ncbi:replication endonuclease [Teichococcus vastitatis]|uniref:replication endonuclease n=1 Tax=Teichococcus vastitatis TaxID=2307076 RepID=UPI000E748BC1|nr:replication endonuclease [Pseudoroseomonas vastitatis]
MPAPRAAQRRLRHLADTRTDTDDIKALFAAQDLRADAEVHATRVAAIEAAVERHRATAEALDEKTRSLRAAQAEAQSVTDALVHLPGTYAYAILQATAARERWGCVPDLADLVATVRRPIDHRRDTDKGLRSRYARALAAGETLRTLGVLPAADGEDRIIEGAGEIGMRLALGDEGQIRAVAEERARAWLEAYVVSPRWREAERNQPWLQAERECPRWQRRHIRTEVRRAQAWLDCALRLVGPASPAVSRFTLGAWRQVQARSLAWASATVVRFESGDEVPLAEVQACSRKSRRAQMYAVVKGMEHHGDEHDMQAFFITLTLPGDYHPFTAGARAMDGSYPHARANDDWNPALGPRAQWTQLQKRWEWIRARLAKYEPLREYFGIAVPEPHKDGTPHLHAMVWLPKYIEHKERRLGTAMVLRGILRDLAPDRQARLEIVRKRPDRRRTDGTMKRYASPASYVMKYVLKSLDDEETMSAGREGAERHRAWASSRGIRRMRLVGVHGSLRIWQRLWTSPDDELLPRRAAMARAAMRRCEAYGAAAKTTEADSPEREVARRDQAAAAAQALRLIGGLPRGDGRLRLGYEETTTEYGRPTKRPTTIREEVRETVQEEYVTKRGQKRTRTVTAWNDTGESMPLKRQEAELVPAVKGAEVPLPSQNGNQVTVVAIAPRDAPAAPPPGADPGDLAAAKALEALIARRRDTRIWTAHWQERGLSLAEAAGRAVESVRSWQLWCERAAKQALDLRQSHSLSGGRGQRDLSV